MQGYITKNQPLDHSKGILSKFHLSLINDKVIENGRLAPSSKPQLSEGKQLLRWLLNEKFRTESDELELEEGFGIPGDEDNITFDFEGKATELATKLRSAVENKTLKKELLKWMVEEHFTTESDELEPKKSDGEEKPTFRPTGKVATLATTLHDAIAKGMNKPPGKGNPLEKELLRWMLKEKFPIKFDSEEQAEELAKKLHEDIINRIKLEHRSVSHPPSEILSKFHKSLLAQEIIDPSRNKLHPEILCRPMLSEGKDYLLWMLAKTLTSDEYGKEIQLATGFGEVEWPQITDDTVEEYLNHLTLAVNQPDENGLVGYIKKNIQLMVPLSQKSVDEIFYELEEKIKYWYKQKKQTKGKWLEKKDFLEWVKEASDQNCLDLINPLKKEERTKRKAGLSQNSSGTESTNWEHLNEVAQTYLLEKRVVFFRSSRKVKGTI